MIHARMIFRDLLPDPELQPKLEEDVLFENECSPDLVYRRRNNKKAVRFKLGYVFHHQRAQKQNHLIFLAKYLYQFCLFCRL